MLELRFGLGCLWFGVCIFDFGIVGFWISCRNVVEIADFPRFSCLGCLCLDFGVSSQLVWCGSCDFGGDTWNRCKTGFCCF